MPERCSARLAGTVQRRLLPRSRPSDRRSSRKFKGLGAYTIPKIDVQVSGTFQSKPGAQLAANFIVSNAVAAASLGRPLSGGAANVTVNLVEPGALYGDRINQLDFRVAKILRFGRTRIASGYRPLQRAELECGPDLQPDLRCARG